VDKINRKNNLQQTKDEIMAIEVIKIDTTEPEHKVRLYNRTDRKVVATFMGDDADALRAEVRHYAKRLGYTLESMVDIEWHVTHAKGWIDPTATTKDIYVRREGRIGHVFG
jgi:hypothetical protein